MGVHLPSERGYNHAVASDSSTNSSEALYLVPQRLHLYTDMLSQVRLHIRLYFLLKLSFGQMRVQYVVHRGLVRAIAKLPHSKGC